MKKFCTISQAWFLVIAITILMLIAYREYFDSIPFFKQLFSLDPDFCAINAEYV